MAKQFPRKLYVKIEKDSNTEYFVADEAAAALVEMNDTAKIATLPTGRDRDGDRRGQVQQTQAPVTLSDLALTGGAARCA